MVTHAASPAKEVPMSDPAFHPESSRQDPSRRRFLKGGAALGAALAAGAGRPIAGRAQPAPDDPSKVLGGPVAALWRALALRAEVRVNAGEDGRVRRQLHAPGRDAGDHHAVGAPLRGPPRRRSRHRPREAPSPDPRPGRSSGDPDRGGDQAPALDLAHPLPRVLGQHAARSGARPRGRPSRARTA